MADEPRIVIKVNKGLKMTPGKTAAQAVHAALKLFGVHPGYPVIVLHANKGPVAAMEAVIQDEGRTEVKPGSTTAGASFDFPVEGKSPERMRWELAMENLRKSQDEAKRARDAYFNSPHYYKEMFGVDEPN